MKKALPELLSLLVLIVFAGVCYFYFFSPNKQGLNKLVPEKKTPQETSGGVQALYVEVKQDDGTTITNIFGKVKEIGDNFLVLENNGKELKIYLNEQTQCGFVKKTFSKTELNKLRGINCLNGVEIGNGIAIDSFNISQEGSIFAKIVNVF